jgi:hypothetical protein
MERKNLMGLGYEWVSITWQSLWRTDNSLRVNCKLEVIIGLVVDETEEEPVVQRVNAQGIALVTGFVSRRCGREWIAHPGGQP